MTEDEIIETRAKAIYSAIVNHPSPGVEWRVSERASFQAACRAAARAALEALKAAGLKLMEREPTKEMRCACRDDYMTSDKEALARLDWIDMWDAAPWWPGEGE